VADLIDRYAVNVRRYLPPALRDTVADAIAVELRTQVLATETHYGRPMTEDEIAALIKVRGHPFLASQPYRTGRYLLIGPHLLPQYFNALRISLMLAFLAIAIVTAFFAASGTPPAVLARYLSTYGRLVIPIVVVVTIAYAVLDAVQARALLREPWDPRTLPPDDPWSGRAVAGAFSDAIVAALFLMAWLALPHHPWLLLGPAADFLTFTSGWDAAYWPVTACAVGALLVHLGAVVRPRLRWLSRWRGVLGNLFSLAGAGILLRAGELLMPAAGGNLDPRLMGLVRMAVRWSLLWTLAIAAFQAVRDAVRAWRRSTTTPT
jgi:hypothetical protein